MYKPSSERRIAAAADREEKIRRRQELKEVVDLALHSPMTSEMVNQLDGEVSISSLKGKNLDVQTAIVVKLATQAAIKGDVKAFEALCKYGGLEPPKQQEVKMELPTFMSDMPDSVKEALAAEAVELAKDDDESDDD